MRNCLKSVMLEAMELGFFPLKRKQNFTDVGWAQIETEVESEISEVN